MKLYRLTICAAPGNKSKSSTSVASHTTSLGSCLFLPSTTSTVEMEATINIKTIKIAPKLSNFIKYIPLSHRDN